MSNRKSPEAKMIANERRANEREMKIARSHARTVKAGMRVSFGGVR